MYSILIFCEALHGTWRFLSSEEGGLLPRISRLMEAIHKHMALGWVRCINEAITLSTSTSLSGGSCYLLGCVPKLSIRSDIATAQAAGDLFVPFITSADCL
jgi:hypothetical protein